MLPATGQIHCFHHSLLVIIDLMLAGLVRQNDSSWSIDTAVSGEGVFTGCTTAAVKVWCSFLDWFLLQLLCFLFTPNGKTSLQRYSSSGALHLGNT